MKVGTILGSTCAGGPHMISRCKTLLILAVLVSAIWQPISSSAGPTRWTAGKLVHAEVRRAGGGRITIAARTVQPFGLARLEGRPLTIECIDARRWSRVAFTYSLLCPVCVDYVSSVALRGHLPNGQKRWIAMVSFGAGSITVDIRKTPASGRCGAPFQDTLYFPSKFSGYLIVV
jgi:hypothetical protein